MKTDPTIIALFQKANYSPEIKYTFNTIFQILGVSGEVYHFKKTGMNIDINRNQTVLLNYGQTKPEGISYDFLIHIFDSSFFGDKYLTPSSLPRMPIDRTGELPVLFSGNGPLKTLVQRNRNEVLTNIDVIASIFFMLTRYEEYIIDKSKDGRFVHTYSIAGKARFLKKPIVNEYVNLIGNWIREGGIQLNNDTLWGENDFAACVTHDIDRVFPTTFKAAFRTAGRDILQKVELYRGWRTLKAYAKKTLGLNVAPFWREPFWVFRCLVRLQNEFDFRSTFFFLADGNSRFDNYYSVKDSRIKKVIKNLRTNGNEIALHGSFNSYRNLELLKKEKQLLEEILGEEVKGIRQHWLKWNNPVTWRLQSKLNVHYDSTLGFHTHEGFRCGTCTPFQPFDVIKRQVYQFWEIPLIVMDQTLYEYRDFTPNKGSEKVFELIDTIKSHRGVFTLLWHNTSFDQERLGKWASIFTDIILYLKENNAQIITLSEVLNYWKEFAFPHIDNNYLP